MRGRVPLPAVRSTRRPAPRPAKGDPIEPRLTTLQAVDAGYAPTTPPERPSERQRLRAAAQAEVGEGWSAPTDLEPVERPDAVDLDSESDSELGPESDAGHDSGPADPPTERPVD